MADFGPHHDNKPKKLTKKLTAPLKMESVTIIFSMFRLVFVEILGYGVRYALIIAKMCLVPSHTANLLPRKMSTKLLMYHQML